MGILTKLNLWRGGSTDNRKNIGNVIKSDNINRIRHNMLTWRDAIAEAEQQYYPHRVKVQQLYNDTRLNGHVDSCIQRRKDLTLLRDYDFFVDGEKNEDIEELFNKTWFGTLVSNALDAVYYGYSLISLGDVEDNSFPYIKLIQRENISPDRLNVTSFPYMTTGAKFNEDPYYKWHIYVDTPSDTGFSKCGIGLMYKVAQYEIICRNILGFNTDAAELYGMPIRHGKTSKTEESERADFANALRYLGSAGWIVTDMQEELELISNSQSGNGYQIYENLETRCEKKISKLILGHADAMDSIAGQLGANDEAQKSLEDVQAKDGKLIETIVNEQVIPKLRLIGFVLPENLLFKFSNSSEIEKMNENENKRNKEVSEIAKTMKDAGLQMDAKYFEERTNIPTTQIVQMPQTLPANISNKLKEFYS